MSEIEFVDLPDKRRGRYARIVTNEMAQAMRANPNQWLLVSRDRVYTPRPRYLGSEYEWTQRKTGEDEITYYCRYVGDPE